MRIGEVAERAGVSVRALRYYDEQQLLPATCTHGGQRQYLDSAVEQVEFIQQLYAAGLSSGPCSGSVAQVYESGGLACRVCRATRRQAESNQQADQRSDSSMPPTRRRDRHRAESRPVPQTTI